MTSEFAKSPDRSRVTDTVFLVLASGAQYHYDLQESKGCNDSDVKHSCHRNLFQFTLLLTAAFHRGLKVAFYPLIGPLMNFSLYPESK